MSIDRRSHTLAQVLADRADTYGNKPWIVTEDKTWSYREMEETTNSLARGLGVSGIASGDTVLVMLPDEIEILHAWCALAKLGAMEVQVNTHLRGGILKHILNDSRARVMIVHAQFLDRISSMAGELDHLEHLILCGDETAFKTADISKALTCSTISAHFSDNGTRLEDGPRYRDLTAVMYTSGTTGPSKGVMITHAHAWEYAHCVIELLELTDKDIHYNPLPLFHIAGQWAGVYACCIAGATVVIPTAFSLTSFWDEIKRHGATCSFLLGAMVNWIYQQEPQSDDADNPLERMIIVPLIPEIEDFKKRFGVLASTTWGGTEMNCPTRSSFTLVNNRTCGRVADDRFDVRIVDEDDEEVPPGIPGQALVRAKEPWIVMAGYWNNPQATAQAWVNQWIHTGDMLSKDEDGNLYFVDRTNDAIRRRGENISSMEVENEVNAHPAVLESAVVPVASADTEQEVMAVVVLREGANLDEEEFIRFLEPRMAYYMVPRYVEVVDALPKTQTGKIQKYDLRARGLTPETWDREAAGVKVTRSA